MLPLENRHRRVRAELPKQRLHQIRCAQSGGGQDKGQQKGQENPLSFHRTHSSPQEIHSTKRLLGK